jgi:uncharacterized protein YidB (DUF937 family)
MSLLESVIGALGQGQGAGAQPDLMNAAGALLGPDGGGLAALLGRLQQGGLGDAAASWVSTGPNQPVSPEQLEGAMGADGLAQLARQFGLDGGGAAGGLGGLPGMSGMSGGGESGLGGLAGALGGLLGGGGGSGGGGASPVAAILATLLPVLVDRLTPDGQLPQPGSTPGSQDLAGLLAGLGPR